MSKYYNPNRTRNIFDPASEEPYKLSRSKLEQFVNCPRCFYLDRRLGIGQPPGFPFSLNSAVDALLKNEFDHYRREHKPHPLMTQYKLDAIPYDHKDIDIWRDALKAGICHYHKETNLMITGGVDDVWINPQEELIIVDYKSTSKDGQITALDQEWQNGYKRQMEIYQWLFRCNNYKVNKTGYFVYCNGDSKKERFDGHLVFDITLIPHIGDDSWVEHVVVDAKKCLMSETIPEANLECDYCRYSDALFGNISR
ncbi:PD-(D/E)XK nuclease family protein [Candidatus Saganbacteria bacterium]|nr:PD-(D/E)XK nuclease family protein [Candidatus Saganbacteria bacterium]